LAILWIFMPKFVWVRKLILFVFLICFGKANASNLQPIGARSAALSHATIAADGILSAFQNQAALATLENFSAGFAIENRFLVPELNIGAFAMAMPTDIGVINMGVQRFGNSLYAESRYGLGFSKSFNEKISLGLQLNYFETRLGENYGTSGRLVGEFGFRVKVSEDLFVGGHLFNPTRVNISKNLTEPIPTTFRLGAQYSFSDQLLTFAEIDKPINGKAQVKAAFEYQFLEKFYLRAGLSTLPIQNSFGFGIQLGALRFDLAAQYNQLLGFSPQVGLIYQPK